VNARIWTDQGPASQGEVITAILQGDRQAAARLLRGWSGPDLVELARAAAELSAMATRESLLRMPPR
jgi:hypothetical protein